MDMNGDRYICVYVNMCVFACVFVRVCVCVCAFACACDIDVHVWIEIYVCTQI